MRFQSKLAAFRSRAGNAAVEFCIVAPLLVLLLGGIVEIGLAIRTSFMLQEGLLSGVNYASHKSWNANEIRTAVLSSSPRLSAATVTVTRSCGCPSGASITTVATCDADPANPGTCPAACVAICPSDQLTARKYATLEVRVPRQRVFGQSFGLPATMSAKMMARVP